MNRVDDASTESNQNKSHIIRSLIALFYLLAYIPLIIIYRSYVPSIFHLVLGYFAIFATLQVAVVAILRRKGFQTWITFFCCDLTGWNYIKSKFKPTGEPSTITFWLIATYAGMSVLASSNFESAAGRITNQANTLFAQISSAKEKGALLQAIPFVQQKKCPVQPSLLEPLTVFVSLFGKEQVYQEGQEILTRTLQLNRQDCGKLDLAGVIGTDRNTTDYTNVNFENSNLTRTYFRSAVFSDGNIKLANFTKADLQMSTFERTEMGRLISPDQIFHGLTLALNLLKEKNLPGTLAKNYLSAKFQDANIYKIKAPADLITFAKREGAVELAPEEWEEFVKNGYEKPIP